MLQMQLVAFHIRHKANLFILKQKQVRSKMTP